MVVAFAASSTAIAHGNPPAGNEVFAVDGEWVCLTNFGVIAASWPEEYVCEEALYASDDFSVAPLTTDTSVTASRTTVATTDYGCNFDRVRGELLGSRRRSPRSPTIRRASRREVTVPAGARIDVAGLDVGVAVTTLDSGLERLFEVFGFV